MKLPPRDLNLGACLPHPTSTYTCGGICLLSSDQYSPKPKKRPKYPLKHRKRAKTPRYLEKDQYTPET